MWIGGLGCLMLAQTGCKKDAPKLGPKASPAPAIAPSATGDAPASAKPSEKVARAVAELSKAWSAVTSFSGKITTKLPDAVGREGRTDGEGTYEAQRSGDKIQIRFELVNTLYFQTDWETKSMLVTAEVLRWVSDGDIMYQSTRQTNHYYKVTKTFYREDDVLQLPAPIVLRDLLRDHTLKLLPDEKLAGRETTVIQATPINGTWQETHYFDKATGIEVKHVEVDQDGKQTYLLTLTELKIDPEFEPDHFKFEMPKEAELIDKTK